MAPGKAKGRDARSRNTTPLSTANHETGPGNTEGHSSTSMSYDDILDRYCKGANPPPSAQLKRIAEALKICSDVAKAHSDTCDRGMREMSRRRKDLLEQSREVERAVREEEERRERQRQQLKLKQEPQPDSRPLATGAHALAPQDGTVTDGSLSKEGASENVQQARTTSPSHTDSTDESHQPPPAPAVPQFQTFGPDPSTFNDPTVYHLRNVHDGLTEVETKEILSVAHYPHSDLHDLTPGTPPDRDFSNAKPPNQVSATAFINYLEPYVRPLVQEDISLLEERGDRMTPMVVPRRGSRSYREIWAAEDSGIFTDSAIDSHSQNQPSGSIDDMNDDTAETNNVAAGPMLSRLLSLLRPEFPQSLAEPNGAPDTVGDTIMNAMSNGERDGTVEPSITSDQPQDTQRPPTFMQESQQPGWRTQQIKQDFATEDDRVRQELVYMGFLPPDAQPDYDGHHDDEVAARLRYLQEELQRISVINGARKARVLELAEERMALQEWSLIADDLDTQINQAYLKRHRNIGKSKGKLKKPGGAGHQALTGISKPSIGEPIRALMSRRIQWSDLIGPVVNHGHSAIPGHTIFEPQLMEKLMAREREGWAEAAGDA